MDNKITSEFVDKDGLSTLSFADLYAFKKFARFQRGYFDCSKEQVEYYTNIILSVEKEMLRRSTEIFGEIPVSGHNGSQS